MTSVIIKINLIRYSYFTWHGEHQLLVDIPHRNKILGALLNILLIQRAFVLKNVQIRHGDGEDFAESSEAAAFQPAQQLRQPRYNAQVQREPLGHQNVFNHHAGLGVERGMVEEVEAVDEHLVRLAEELGGGGVEEAEGAQHLEAQLLLLHVSVRDGQGAAQDVPAAGQQEGQHHLQSALLHKSTADKKRRSFFNELGTTSVVC